MKVLHLINSVAGGAGHACLNLHQALMAKGIDSKVLHLAGKAVGVEGLQPVKSTATFFRSVLRKLGLSHRKEDQYAQKIKKLKGNYEAVSLPFSSYQLHLHPLVAEAAIIHLHWVGDFVDLSSFFENVKKPIVWTLHDLNPLLGICHYEHDVKDNPQLQMIEKEIADIKQALFKKYRPHFIATSKYTLERVFKYLGAAEVSMISCLVPTDQYYPFSKKQAKQNLKINDKAFVIGIGAQYLDVPRKGYSLFWQSLEALKNQLPPSLQLITFGNFRLKQQPKCAFPIHHLGQVKPSEMSKIYSAMDLFVNVSKAETFGQTALEAMLCNTPTLSSVTGAMPEYIADEDYLFEVNHQEEFNEKLLALVNRLQAEKITNTREKALNWCKETDVVAKHIQLYQKMVASA